MQQLDNMVYRCSPQRRDNVVYLRSPQRRDNVVYRRLLFVRHNEEIMWYITFATTKR